MLSISETKGTITNVTPRLVDGRLQADITVGVAVADGPQLLRQIHAHALVATCWDESGESAVTDYDIRCRHKTEGCALTLSADKQAVALQGTFSHMKLCPTANRGLEVSFKCVAPASSGDVAALADLWLHASVMLTARERQVSLDLDAG